MAGSGLLISVLEKFNWFCLTGLITLVLLMGLFLRKNHLLRCCGCISLLNWIWALTLSVLLIVPSRKLDGTLICSMKSLSPEVALYLYKSTMCPCIEHCCHIWVPLVGTWNC